MKAIIKKIVNFLLWTPDDEVVYNQLLSDKLQEIADKYKTPNQ